MSENVTNGAYRRTIIDAVTVDLGTQAHLYFGADSHYTIATQGNAKAAYLNGRARKLKPYGEAQDCDEFAPAMKVDMIWLNHKLRKKGGPNAPKFAFTILNVIRLGPPIGGHAFNLMLGPDDKVYRVDAMAAVKWGISHLVRPYKPDGRLITYISVF